MISISIPSWEDSQRGFRPLNQPMHLIFPFRVGICFKGRVAKPEASLGQSMESAVPGRKTLHPESLTRFQNTNAQECNVHALRKSSIPLVSRNHILSCLAKKPCYRYGTVQYCPVEYAIIDSGKRAERRAGGRGVSGSV
jgi:hypothetical protein